jgi:hypothetical protein
VVEVCESVTPLTEEESEKVYVAAVPEVFDAVSVIDEPTAMFVPDEEVIVTPDEE